MSQTFTVGLTRDFLTPQGTLTYQDIGLSVLDAEPRISHHFLDRHEPTIQAAQIGDVDAIFSLTPKYTPQSFEGVDRLVAIVRFGVGYDMVDVAACTDSDVLLCITAGAVNHSVAEATIGWMLALSHRMVDKDRLTREGRWADRSAYMGSELRDRCLGVVGLGGIGGRLIELLRGFGMSGFLAFDPYCAPERAQQLGAQLVPLEQLMQQSDFISVNCPLTPETRNLIDADQLAMMKPEAYLINTARGGIVNEQALLKTLENHQIAGAATDVFAAEPVPSDDPLLRLDNLLVAPHSIAWTNELFRDIGLTGARALVTLAHGDIPSGVVNHDVLQKRRFQAKLARFKTP